MPANGAKKRALKPSEAKRARADLSGPTPRQIERLCEAILAGATRKAARGVAGIQETTFYNWLARGKHDESGPCYELRRRMLEAEDQIEETMAGHITDAAPEDWKAAAWWLERRRGKAFGKQQAEAKVAATASATATATVDDAQLRASLLAALQSAKVAP